MMVEPLIYSVSLGCLVGVVMGITGAGGSVFSIPMLVFCMNLTLVEAVPISLLTVMLSTLSATVLGLAKGLVRYRAAALLLISGLFLVPFGVFLAHQLPHHMLELLFIMVMLFLAVRSLISYAHDNDDVLVNMNVSCQLDQKTNKLYWTKHCARKLVMTGALAGFLSGLLGVGGGFVISPALRKLSNFEAKMVVATSLSVVAAISVIGLVTYATQVQVDWQIAFPFAGGALMGMLVGLKISDRISKKTNQLFFGLLTLLVAIVFSGELLLKLI